MAITSLGFVSLILTIVLFLLPENTIFDYSDYLKWMERKQTIYSINKAILILSILSVIGTFITSIFITIKSSKVKITSIRSKLKKCGTIGIVIAAVCILIFLSTYSSITNIDEKCFLYFGINAGIIVTFSFTWNAFISYNKNKLTKSVESNFEQDIISFEKPSSVDDDF